MNKQNIKIIFFGTSDFAVLTLEALVKNGYEIITVVTTPDEPAGRKQILTPPPVKIRAQGLGFRVLQPINLKDPKFLNDLYPTPSTLSPDVGVVAAYGKIIPAEIINIPRHDLLNIHPSLLPKYRGPTPIQSAILNGEKETGITIIKIDEEVDHGPIIGSRVQDIGSSEKYEELETKLAKSGAELLIKILPDYLTGKVKLVEQDHGQATFTKKFTIEDGEIKPNDTAEAAYNKIRALNPEPGTYIWINRKNKKTRLKVLEAQLLSYLEAEPLSKGLCEKNGFLALGLKNGSLLLKLVQPEGKKPMKGEDFARGNRDFIGTILE